MKPEVIIIDDEEINLDILNNMLNGFDELKGYLIKTFIDPREALNYCINNENVRLILIDQNMNGLTGLKFIDEYNLAVQDGVRSSIIMNSTANSVESISAALDKGVDDYFVKPFDANILRARIRNSIAKDALRHQLFDSKQNKAILLRVLIHDISTPLTVAMALAKKINTANPSELHEKLNQKFNSILDIIRSIRDSEALESKKISFNLTEIVIKDVIEQSIQHVLTSAFDKNISFNFKSKLPNDTRIVSDMQTLKYQIISNLFTNAIKFSPASSEILVELDKTDQAVILKIRDYGIGIPEGILSNIFKWGAKTNRKGTMNESGTGFGMPIVKKFVDELGHKIEIHSWTTDTDQNKQGTEIILEFKQKK